MEIRAFLDYETEPCSRANGIFQVFELKDNDGNDLTHLASPNKTYTSIEELKKELNIALNMPLSSVEIIVED